MSEYAAINNDRSRVQQIRNQYVDRKETKFEQLNRLDSKVKAPGKVLSTIIGVVGSLIMGAGMAYIMVWNVMQTGLVLSIPGMLIALLAYPVYKLITGNRKKKYAEEIIKLSDELAG
jgi:hypothetical protein